MISSTNPSRQPLPVKQEERETSLAHCTLKWRRAQLLVKFSSQGALDHPPLIENRQQLISCLQCSPVRLVRIDPGLGERALRFWADACQQADKAVFLWIPTAASQPKKQAPLKWQFKRLLDYSAAVLLLLILSPLMLGLILLLFEQSTGSIFTQQWRIGERGKLFQLLQFRTTVANVENLHQQKLANQKGLHENDLYSAPIEHWMLRHHLDKLPHLLNVLRGEMSLVGPAASNLADAVQLHPTEQQLLNTLPGIIGSLSYKTKSKALNLNESKNLDLKYQQNWSLSKDLQSLAITVSKLFSGSSN